MGGSGGWILGGCSLGGGAGGGNVRPEPGESLSYGSRLTQSHPVIG